MDAFEKWIATGPLADEPIDERTRTMLRLAFIEGQLEQNTKVGESLTRLLSPTAA